MTFGLVVVGNDKKMVPYGTILRELWYRMVPFFLFWEFLNWFNSKYLMLIRLAVLLGYPFAVQYCKGEIV